MPKKGHVDLTWQQVHEAIPKLPVDQRTERILETLSSHLQFRRGWKKPRPNRAFHHSALFQAGMGSAIPGSAEGIELERERTWVLLSTLALIVGSEPQTGWVIVKKKQFCFSPAFFAAIRNVLGVLAA
jgi:hypothetical protein